MDHQETMPKSCLVHLAGLILVLAANARILRDIFSCEACNEGRTDDGVEQGGARLAAEVRCLLGFQCGMTPTCACFRKAERKRTRKSSQSTEAAVDCGLRLEA